MPDALIYAAMATVTAASAIDSSNQAKKQGKEMEKQAKLENAIEGESSARARRAAASEAQVARAQIENQGATAGFAGTAVSAAGDSVTNQYNKTSQDLAFTSQSNAAINQGRVDVQKAGQKSDLGVALGVASSFTTPVVGAKLGKMMSN